MCVVLMKKGPGFRAGAFAIGHRREVAVCNPKNKMATCTRTVKLAIFENHVSFARFAFLHCFFMCCHKQFRPEKGGGAYRIKAEEGADAPGISWQL